MKKRKVLLTGAAGFIGMHSALKLCLKGCDVIGLDNLNSYYDVDLKYQRLRQLGVFEKTLLSDKLVQSTTMAKFSFVRQDISDADALNALFDREQFTDVVHLAAQAGVRYSVKNPYTYIKSNISGFLNVIEACRQYGVNHLVYASSSSVYGLSSKAPFSESACTESPASLYAATKKSNELIAHSYSHLFKLATTGLRFFTVYGPWGRPDMALFLFTSKIISGEPIEVYGNGEMYRDFTYVDDAVDALVGCVNAPASNKRLPYQVFNVGRAQSVPVTDYIEAIEKAVGKKAIIIHKDAHPADVKSTEADITRIRQHINFDPRTSIKEGVQKFVDWYLEIYVKNQIRSHENLFEGG